MQLSHSWSGRPTGGMYSNTVPHIMIMNAAGIYGDPDAVMRQSFRNVQKFDRWIKTEYEHLIDTPGERQEQEKRLASTGRPMRCSCSEAPILSLVYQDHAYLTKPWVKRLPHSPLSLGAFWKDVLLASGDGQRLVAISSSSRERVSKGRENQDDAGWDEHDQSGSHPEPLHGGEISQQQRGQRRSEHVSDTGNRHHPTYGSSSPFRREDLGT